MSEAVVIGAGPNGLVAANLLVDAGWEVTVIEAEDEPGGAVRSRQDLFDGAITDICSAFYPLAAASSIIRGLQLEKYGLAWSHAPLVLAHPLEDGRCPVLSRDLDETVDSLDALGVGDGERWRRMHDLWLELQEPLLESLFTPFPPVRAGLRLAKQVRAARAIRLTRLALLPIRRCLEEQFDGPGGLLLAGCALHTDLAPESAGGAFFGWFLAMLGQQFGWPVVTGGAQRLSGALVSRLRDRGGILRCGERVTKVLVQNGRAVGVRTELGEEVRARSAVLADVVAPSLYGTLVDWEHLPSSLVDDMRRFQWDWATFKVDWLLDRSIPWAASRVSRAGTVHLGGSLDAMTRFGSELATGLIPSDPFVLLGQMNVADPSRSPAGTSTVWGYTHVPRKAKGDAGGQGLDGRWRLADAERMADRIECRIDRFAPGFRAAIRDRSILSPRDLEAHDSNLVGGGINGGTASLHQQLMFRPSPGFGRPETPVAGLFLASSSAHPGGGVHGACGANAARAALKARRLSGRASSSAVRWVERRLS